MTMSMTGRFKIVYLFTVRNIWLKLMASFQLLSRWQYAISWHRTITNKNSSPLFRNLQARTPQAMNIM